MAIITLTTDLGLKDHYVSAIKGSILKNIPNVSIVDISHQIPTYNIQDAAYILKNAYPNFPKGSIHIIGIKAEQTNQSSHVIVFSDGHYFIGADNGIFSFLDTSIDKIIELPPVISTFPTRDVFAVAASAMAKGVKIEELGQPKENLLERMPFRAASMGDMIRGTVEYIDSYGNVMCNISQALFAQVGKGREFKIEFARYEIFKISKTYNDVPEGEILALFNAANQLEISMNSDRANSMLNLKLNDSITIRFQ
ncbi:MAG: SAM-dependent chlorinase/fluorinase [Bacteroidetes bacterium]|nr:SAM-dependent chlorinase/fluorinase [Bacteroidota bacterium]